jgi:hypothetical protein
MNPRSNYFQSEGCKKMVCVRILSVLVSCTRKARIWGHLSFNYRIVKSRTNELQVSTDTDFHALFDYDCKQKEKNEEHDQI